MDTVTPSTEPAPRSAAPEPAAADRAMCVLCSEPTEYPASTRGATLCPVCEWQQGEREAACAC